MLVDGGGGGGGGAGLSLLGFGLGLAFFFAFSLMDLSICVFFGHTLLVAECPFFLQI